MALAMQANIEAVGMPQLVGARPDVRARVAAAARGAGERACRPKSSPIAEPSTSPCPAAPTTSATCRGSCRRRMLSYPSNVPGMTAHHWSSAMAMATPIAHQGATAGAKVIAATLLDLMTWTRGLRDQARRATSATSSATARRYEPFIGAGRRAADREERARSWPSSGIGCARSITTRRATRPTSSSSA